MGLERAEIKAYCEHLIEDVEESLSARLQGDDEAIESARAFLCEQASQVSLFRFAVP